MSALSFARQAFGREKPHSSTTDWIDILTASNIEEEAYDGIPELVDSINLQAGGPAEASRALRKKLKHGNVHQQFRALVLLKALVENCGSKFQTTFADGQLTDAMKNMISDPNTDKRVQKKLLFVLASWRDQFKSDPSMTLVAGLYKQCYRGGKGVSIEEFSQKKKARKEKEEPRESPKIANDGQLAERGSARRKRPPFVFEKEKPKILTSIVDASQASSNLINAIKLVNPEKERIQTNEQVQVCVEKAREARKAIVRYIQLVENDELIGTLIETNERVIGAIETYDRLIAEEHNSTSGTNPSAVPSTPRITISESGDYSSQERKIVDSRYQERNGNLHPDLQDLDFGSLGGSSNNLPPPIRPSTFSDNGRHRHAYDERGSLSDFSDYESSDEGTHGAPSSSRKNYVNVSDDPDDDGFRESRSSKAPLVNAQDDPFADPFADNVFGPVKKQ